MLSLIKSPYFEEVPIHVVKYICEVIPIEEINSIFSDFGDIFFAWLYYVSIEVEKVINLHSWEKLLLAIAKNIYLFPLY